MYDVIEKKRDGMALSEEDIRYFVNEYTNGQIPDYQVSALLMAIYFNDMTDEERAVLTTVMTESGDQIDLSNINGIKVDKHSTGGVGDTTTLVLAPLVASLGVPVAKMSGRGLGHTGGTIDKLEAVPGFHVDVTTDEFIDLVNQNKVAVIGQTGNLTPADKKLYSLRDVTATVDSIPLIASSIMSKKIASGADSIVLDVKTGSGAFMSNPEDARNLADAMVTIGNRVGRQTMAVISDMNQPLGHAVGNALEIKEAIETLKGNGPDDLTELCLTLGSQMVVLGGKAASVDEARALLEAQIHNGKALEQFKTFLSAQGGDASVADDPDKLPESSYKIELPAASEGFISGFQCHDVGAAAAMLGAGRTTKDSQINLSVGIVLNKKLGDFVHKGESLATIHANTTEIDQVKQTLSDSIHITSHQANQPTLIYDTITRD